MNFALRPHEQLPSERLQLLEDDGELVHALHARPDLKVFIAPTAGGVAVGAPSDDGVVLGGKPRQSSPLRRGASGEERRKRHQLKSLGVLNG